MKHGHMNFDEICKPVNGRPGIRFGRVAWGKDLWLEWKNTVIGDILSAYAPNKDKPTDGVYQGLWDHIVQAKELTRRDWRILGEK